MAEGATCDDSAGADREAYGCGGDGGVSGVGGVVVVNRGGDSVGWGDFGVLSFKLLVICF